jgi:hypothetical protein
MFTFKGTRGFMKNDYCLKHLRYFFISFLIILFNACSSTDENPLDTGLKYFPLQVGNYWIYDVTEITFDTLIQNITENYQERYEVVDSFENQLSEIAYVIHVSKRDDVDAAWEFDQTWTARLSNANEIIVAEENTPYVKLILPIREGATWLGNKYNTIEAERSNSRVDNYVFQNVKDAFDVYNNTITVQESSDLNLIYKDIRSSTYAEEIGLVYRINQYVDYCDENSCLGQYRRKHEQTKIQILAEHDVQ